MENLNKYFAKMNNATVNGVRKELQIQLHTYSLASVATISTFLQNSSERLNLLLGKLMAESLSHDKNRVLHLGDQFMSRCKLSYLLFILGLNFISYCQKMQVPFSVLVKCLHSVCLWCKGIFIWRMLIVLCWLFSLGMRNICYKHKCFRSKL